MSSPPRFQSAALSSRRSSPGKPFMLHRLQNNSSSPGEPVGFLGTPYSMSKFDYPFPVAHAPPDPILPPQQPSSAMPIASSIVVAPSMAQAVSDSSPNMPSLVTSVVSNQETQSPETPSKLRHSDSLSSLISSASSAHSRTRSVSPNDQLYSTSPSRKSPVSSSPPASKHMSIVARSGSPIQSYPTAISGGPIRRPKSLTIGHSSASTTMTSSSTGSSMASGSVSFSVPLEDPHMPPTLVNKINRASNSLSTQITMPSASLSTPIPIHPSPPPEHEAALDGTIPILGRTEEKFHQSSAVYITSTPPSESVSTPAPTKIPEPLPVRTSTPAQTPPTRPVPVRAYSHSFLLPPAHRQLANVRDSRPGEDTLSVPSTPPKSPSSNPLMSAAGSNEGMGGDGNSGAGGSSSRRSSISVRSALKKTASLVEIGLEGLKRAASGRRNLASSASPSDRRSPRKRGGSIAGNATRHSFESQEH